MGEKGCRLAFSDLLSVSCPKQNCCCLYFFFLMVSDMERMGFPGGTSGKETDCQSGRHETWVRPLGWEDPLEEGMATHSSILA